MKVADLEGAELDYWVAKAAGMPVNEDKPTEPYALGVVGEDGTVVAFEPSRNWAQGGPIIDKCNMSLMCQGHNWMARTVHVSRRFLIAQAGLTPLIAAMRCFVSSRFGEEVGE